MDKTGIVPGYCYGTSLGTYFSWQAMYHTFTWAIHYYKTNGKLPATSRVRPKWVLFSPSWHTFTNANIWDAAQAVFTKMSADADLVMPGSVTITENSGRAFIISEYSYFYLLSWVVQNIVNNNLADTVDTWTFKDPESNKENIVAGKMAKSEYLHFADVVKQYFEKTNYVPGYAVDTSLGPYWGWKTMFYTFVEILNIYRWSPTHRVLDPVWVYPWPQMGGSIL
jgi:hypothetical protein